VRVAFLALALVFCLMLVATGFLFVRPGVDEPRRADAVVMLGPGLNGERTRQALALVRRRLAPVLVVSRTRDLGWEAGRELCMEDRPPKIVCIRAAPYTTRGEARAVGRLASRRGWRSLLVVTSTYHVTRARLLYRRCFDGRVDVVGADPNAGPAEWAGAIAHEWGGLAYAVMIARGC
jgi:uncharacterized SAM-binding protein YcdF (DUF218 family)